MTNAPMKLSASLVLAALMATACVTAPRKGEVAAEAALTPCGQRAEDSVYARTAPVYRDCSVQKPAKQIPSNVRPDFSPEVGGASCYSVELEFVVSESGAYETGTARVLRTTNQPFAESIVTVLPRWKWDPAMLNGKAVRQIINMKQSAQLGTVVRVVASGSGPPPSTRPPRGSTTPKC